MNLPTRNLSNHIKDHTITTNHTKHITKVPCPYTVTWRSRSAANKNVLQTAWQSPLAARSQAFQNPLVYGYRMAAQTTPPSATRSRTPLYCSYRMAV